MKFATWLQIERNLFKWGNWYIAKGPEGYRLMVSSGHEYGPFPSLRLAMMAAEIKREARYAIRNGS